MSEQNSIRCFLVDDDQDDQEIFTLAVRDVNKFIECIHANDGVHALEKLNADPSLVPTCIFIDMNMPRMNGMETLAAIKKIDRLQQVPVYMCSTSSDPRIIAETKSLGARDFIIKPSTIGELTSILTEVYEKIVKAGL